MLVTRPALTKSEQMARVKSADTGPERRLRSALWRAGGRFRLRRQLPGSPDLVFVGARVAVFVDGCFWHGCPAHYSCPATNATFWKAKLARNTQRDRRVEVELSRLGWTVLRVWEHELVKSTPRVVSRVLRVVAKRRQLLRTKPFTTDAIL